MPLALLAVCACSSEPGAVQHPHGAAAGATPDCEGIGRSTAPLSVVDRSLVGSAATYPADPTLRPRAAELKRSQRLRREVAWSIAARVLAPLSIPQPLIPAAARATLPTFQTWHAKDDVTRIFRHLYPELTPDEQASRARLSAAAIDKAWAWNDGAAIADFEDWTFERLVSYQAGIDEASELAGLGGVYRVAYAPAASRHWLDSYPELLACSDSEPDELESPAWLGTSLADACGREQPSQPACLNGPFPDGAALIKASWRRADVATPLPTFDTSSAALARRLSADGRFAWGEGDGQADPGPEDIYTLTLPNGNAFRLAALHIMTKELDDWFWTTLWWSPEPNLDFGADRPALFPEAFLNYKLCSVVAFDEQDADPSGGFEAEHPSLAQALSVTYGGSGGPSWCSNPYLEEGDGNAATNCIGCHQHAGTRLSSEEILGDGERFPEHGRTLLRRAFPSDYVFAATAGDAIGAMLVETESHFSPP